MSIQTDVENHVSALNQAEDSTATVATAKKASTAPTDAIIAEAEATQRRFMRWIKTSVVLLFVAFMFLGVFATQTLGASGADTPVVTATATTAEASGITNGAWAFIGAAIAIGLSIIGAGIAVGNVGSAALGALGENPKIFGQAVIFVGLAEGLAIFGFIISFLILQAA